MANVNETNRKPDGSFAALEAVNSFTDPSGATYTGRINPVLVTEESATFEEDGVIINLNDVNVSDGSLLLGESLTGNITSRPNDNNDSVADFRAGLKINPNLDLEGVEITISSNTSGLTKVYLFQTDGTLIDSDTVDGNKVFLQGVLTAGTGYYVTADAEGSDYTQGKAGGQEYPYTGTDLDITSGASGTSDVSTIYNIVSVEGAVEAKDGNAVIEWQSASPADIVSWDLATFQRTLDNETMTVDIEDGNGNVLFADVTQNFDISTVDTAKNVKLRANLSRDNTANNPSLDYVARRFQR